MISAFLVSHLPLTLLCRSYGCNFSSLDNGMKGNELAAVHSNKNMEFITMHLLVFIAPLQSVPGSSMMVRLQSAGHTQLTLLSSACDDAKYI